MLTIRSLVRIALTIEWLEERCVLSQWPVPINAINSILGTYGQFDNRGEQRNIIFHAGLDIGLNVGAEVKAIEAGTLHHKGDQAADPFGRWVSVSTTATSGWNYFHINPDANLPANGQQIFKNQVLGTVAAHPAGYPSHLHLEAAGGPDPTFPGLLRPIDDPLARLDPLGDVTVPTIGDVFFLRGEDDNNIPHALKGGPSVIAN